MLHSILRAPYQSWTAEALLQHFRTRTTVRYFPILDAEQCSPEQIAGILNNEFTFNHESYQLPAGFDWTHNPSQDIEWLILLHKFYFAAGLGHEYQKTLDRRYLDKWVELTESWIDTVPLDFLTSDVMGRRVQNWLFAYYYFVTQTNAPIPAAFHQKLLVSLHSQVSHLCTHLTPARNHRTIELYAIFLAAVVFPEMQDAAEWLTYSRQLLLENMQADFLADGVHCELSTDYHHLVLRNYLGIMKLAHLNQIEMPTEMDGYLQKALDFAKYVHKPDGTVPSLSDGDVRDFRELLMQGYALYDDEELLYVATQGEKGCAPSQRTRYFPTGGYAIQRSGWGEGERAFADESYLIFDCGPLGAGNHGHLDLLSFEMAAYGRSLIVDPGRYTYHEPKPESGQTNWRARFRGTAYHNTVLIDGKEQIRYQFHKNRYRIQGPASDYTLKEICSGDEYDYLHGIAASHEYPVIHERKILFAHRAYWVITDILRPLESTATESHSYDLHFHLSDEATGKVLTHFDDTQTLIDAPHLVFAHVSLAEPPAQYALLDGYISRTYGVKEAAPIVRFSYQGGVVVAHTLLYPYQEERPNIELSLLPVLHAGLPIASADAFTLQISVRQGENAFTDTYFSANVEGQQVYTVSGQSFTEALHFTYHQRVLERTPLR